MPVPRPDQGMSNFVQQRVADGLPAVALGEIPGKFDGPLGVPAKTEAALAAVEGERPAMQTVLFQQSQGELANFRKRTATESNSPLNSLSTTMGERRGVSPTCLPHVHVGLTPRRSPTPIRR